MKNRLQKAFSHEDPTDYIGTLKFADEDSLKEFERKLEILNETGVPQSISGVDKIVMNQRIDGTAYPLAEHEKLERVYIAPSPEEVPIEVHTKFGNYMWTFNRVHTKNGTILSNNPSNIVYIRLEFKDKTVNFTYKSNPQSAKSISELVKTYNATLSLFKKLFGSADKLLNDIERLRYSIKLWEHALALEEELKVSFDPRKISNDPSDREWIEELYLIIIEGYIIRENYKIDDIIADSNFPEEIKEGSAFAFTFDNEREYNLLGIEITLFAVNVAFNLIIDSVSENEDLKKYTIKTRDSDLSPAFISYKGFLTKEKQESERESLLSNFNENVLAYRNAHTLNELLAKSRVYKTS